MSKRHEEAKDCEGLARVCWCLVRDSKTEKGLDVVRVLHEKFCLLVRQCKDIVEVLRSRHVVLNCFADGLELQAE